MSECTVYFVRHGLTTSNEKGFCCGSTDALVSEQGRQELKKLKELYRYPAVDHLYASPAIRCRETASILFPDMVPELIENFWEFDFGVMEDHPVSDFMDASTHRKWLAQAPDLGFSGGETLLEAQYRALAGMTRVVADVRRNGYQSVAIVAHGEIFALLFQAALLSDQPPEAFLLCPNGMGIAAQVDTEKWFQDRKMTFLDFFPANAPRLRAEDSPYFQPLSETESSN